MGGVTALENGCERTAEGYRQIENRAIADALNRLDILRREVAARTPTAAKQGG
jgi:hypothetical protein